MSDSGQKKKNFYSLGAFVLLLVVVMYIGNLKRGQLQSLGPEAENSQDISNYDISPEMMNIIKKSGSWDAIGPEYYGKPAPDMSFTDVDGVGHRISDYKGMNVMLVLWATWCPPCNVEVGHLKELTDELPEDEFKILAVSYEDEGEGVVKRFVEDKGINYTTAWMNHNDMVAPYIHAMAVPSAFFVGPDGNFKLISQGLMDKKSVIAIVEN